MINFFRKTRKKLADDNKPLKYARYAIGEIVLVMVGILLALQVNNWNEERKGIIKEYAVLNNLIQDLKSDSTSYNKNYKTLTDIKSLHKNLYEIGVNGENNIIIEKPNYIRRTLYYNPITIENDPFVSNKISSDEVRKEILSYFRYAKNMDDSYSEFKDVIHNRMRIFLSQKEVHNVSRWFNNQNLESVNIISQEDLVTLSKLPEFQQLLFEASVKLSEVIVSLDILIDQNNRLKDILKEELKL